MEESIFFILKYYHKDRENIKFSPRTPGLYAFISEVKIITHIVSDRKFLAIIMDNRSSLNPTYVTTMPALVKRV